MSEPVENPQVRHESADVKYRAIVTVALVLVAVMVAIHFALAGLWGLFAAREAPSRRAGVLQAAPEPRLQAAPAEDEAALVREQQKRLHSYGWVDRKKGVVHMPVERAMELSTKS